jgi:hypothetical protein
MKVDRPVFTVLSKLTSTFTTCATRDVMQEISGCEAVEAEALNEVTIGDRVARLSNITM